MKKLFFSLLGVAALCLFAGDADGRGFGGFGGGRSFGGGGWGGGFRSEGFGGDRSFDAGRSWGGGGWGGSFDSSRSFGAGEGWRGGYAGESYDRSYTGSRGGSVNVDGERGVAEGPRGGYAAGGTRDVSATGPNGRTYDGSRSAGVAAGPYGRTVGGAERSGTATGPRGAVGWESAFGGYHNPYGAGGHMSTDFGLAHYSNFNTAAVGHTTAYWSHGVITNRAGYVRTNFGYYNAFRGPWYVAHPGAWMAAGWAAATAWDAVNYATLASYCALPAAPVYYDYGNTIIYQDNNVYQDGQDLGSAETYSQQATALADQGQQAPAPIEDTWKPIGVFALVQGDEKSSNNIFQMAINKEGTIRGNYYDGLMDTTTPIYGSVDKKTQRAAWTIGKKNDRVFETGLYNLTKNETPILVHFGNNRTQQWLLVRMEQPKSGN